MARKFFILLLAAGLALAGCGAPDTQAEQAGNSKEEQRPPHVEKDAPEKRSARAEEADEPKPESKPKPDPGSKSAPKPEPEPDSRSKPRPKPAPSKDATASTSASSSTSASASGTDGDYDATVTVSRVVDGDTVEVDPAIDGITDVRLIGMDTPETKDPNEEVEPYGPEASAFATDELTGRSVGLEFGAEKTDQYDRLLAYVYAGGEMFNEVLVEEGYAQAYPYEPNTEYADRFAAAQEEAKASGSGIWGLPLGKQCLLANHGNGIGEGSPGCGGSTASATASPEPTFSASPSAAPSGGGSGVASTGAGDIDCDQVNGPIPTPAGDPDGLDGDGDGLACE